MAISVAILGASGSVGTALGAHLLRSGLLEPQDRLQLVGHGNPKSDARLLATRIDLLDAFDDSRIEVDGMDVNSGLGCSEWGVRLGTGGAR